MVIRTWGKVEVGSGVSKEGLMTERWAVAVAPANCLGLPQETSSPTMQNSQRNLDLFDIVII
jgi:hypothetical protein